MPEEKKPGDPDVEELEQMLRKNEEAVSRVRAMLKALKKQMEQESGSKSKSSEND